MRSVIEKYNNTTYKIRKIVLISNCLRMIIVIIENCKIKSKLKRRNKTRKKLTTWLSRIVVRTLKGKKI